ncbi:MAG: rod-binding protein [Paracoccaceae bacterium]
MIPPLSASTMPPLAPDRSVVLMEAAKQLEAAFLSEMLSFSGLGAVSAEFGGGAGEEQFSSFLRAEQARLMVDRGGIGLARSIFDSLVAKAGDAGNDTA